MKINYSIIIFVALLLIFVSTATDNSGWVPSLDTVPEAEIPLGEQTIEGELVSRTVLSATGDNYVDATQNQVYGTTTSNPPSGMGVDDITSSDLLEEAWDAGVNDDTGYSYPFTSSLSPWTTYTVGSLDTWAWQSTGGQSGGWAGIVSAGQEDGGGGVRSPDIYHADTEEITITWYWKKSVTQAAYYMKAKDSGLNYDIIKTYAAATAQTTWASDYWITTDSQYFHSAFDFEFECSDCSDDAYVGLDTVTVTVVYSIDSYRFEAVYRFDSVDYSYNNERLYCDFDDTSNGEWLNFYGGTTTNPTTELQTWVVGNSDFDVDIHSTLTGTPYYVKILDPVQDDIVQSTWKIDRLYIKITNTAPVNDANPTIATLDDTDNLFARYRIYEVTTYHSDVDGFGTIDYIQFYVYNDAQSVLYFYGKFIQDTHGFSEEGTTEQKDNWELTTSTYSEHDDTELDVTWKFRIEWDCEDPVDFDVRCYIIDDDASVTSTYYDELSDGTLRDCDIETRVDWSVTPFIYADSGGGTDDRGNLDGYFLMEGNLKYYGSTLIPPDNQVNVWISCSEYGTNVGPWVDGLGDSGQYRVTCYGDDEVGLDAYTVKPVKNGGGSTGTSLYYTTPDVTIDYIADQILVTLIDADGLVLDPDIQVNLTVGLDYEYDSDPITAGTFSLRYGSTYLTLTHDVSGNWTVSEVSSNPTSRTYDYVNGTATLHGITIVNMNSKTVTVSWDRIVLTVWINHHWRVVDYNTTIWVTGVYEGQGWTWNGTAAFNSTAGVYPVETTAANYTYVVQSITDPDYGLTAFTADDVWCIFDDASISSVSYFWTQYSVDQVWIVWMSGTWTWTINGTTLDTGAEGDCKIRSYMNATDDDWAIMDSVGQVGDLVIGAFDPSWYYVNLTMNCETTVNGTSYDWIVWTSILEVDILHSIHIVDSVVYLTDNYVTVGVYTNWDNASIIVWDQLISNTVPVHFQPNEGWFQILKSDVVGAHNLTILVNGTHNGVTYDGNTQDWSENDSWEWFQFVYTISETVLTYETSIVVIDNLGEVIAFETFEVYRNDTRIYQPLIVTYSSYAYNITIKDRWGEVLNSTIFATGDYEFVLIVTVYSFKVMSWYEDFCYFNITHGGITYTEVVAPLETIYFRLYEGSYNWGVNYRNGTSVGGNLNLVNSTAIIVTGDTIADVAGLSDQILDMTTEINITVYSTYDQTVTIQIDLSNVNSTIYDQTISILTNVENTNSTIYSQTVTLLADISNVNSTLYAQTVTILADLQNINSTLYAQTVSILTMVQSVNSTLYNATISVFNHISAVNSTLYGMLVDLVNDISVVNSTIYGDLIVDLDNIWSGVSTLDTKITYTNTKISNVKKALADDIADNSTMVATMNIVGIATVILSGVIVAIMVKYKKIQFFSDDELVGEEKPPEDEWSEDIRDFKKALKIGSNDADGKFTRRRNDTSTREEQRQKSDEVNDRWRRRKQIT